MFLKSLFSKRFDITSVFKNDRFTIQLYIKYNFLTIFFCVKGNLSDTFDLMNNVEKYSIYMQTCLV